VDGVILTAFAVSFLFAGALIGAFGPRAAYAVAGLGCGLTGLIMLPVLRERQAGREPPSAVVEAAPA
jgi:hypothetical protein